MNTTRIFAFEGPDGSGKSTLAKLVVDELKQVGYTVYHFRLPGGTGLGEGIRHLLLDPTIDIDPMTQAHLLAANRSHYEHDIQKIVRDNPNAIVIMERWTLSSEVFQKQLLIEMDCDQETRDEYMLRLKELNGIAANTLLPYYIYITASEETRVARKLSQGVDRYEVREIEFHRAIERHYKEWVQDNIEKGSVAFFLNDSQSPESVAKEIALRINNIHGGVRYE
jgi:dTMP kinase